MFGMCVAGAGVVIALLVPPPRFALRAVAASAAPWLLDDALDDGRLESATRRFVKGYLRNAAVGRAGKRITFRDEEPDHVVLARMMVAMRNLILWPDPFSALPTDAPSLLSGVGVCDQINGSVCVLAARRFPRVQLFGLYDDGLQMSPHTIGRAWSEQRRQWLYFDATGQEAVIFTRAADGSPHYLSAGFGPPIESRIAIPRAFYSYPGWVMNEYHESFAEHTVVKLSQTFSSRPLSDGLDPVDETPAIAEVDERAPERSAAAKQAADRPARTSALRPRKPRGTFVLAARPPLKPDVVIATVIPPALRDDETFCRAARAFAKARVDHFLSGTATAYHAVIRDFAGATDPRVVSLVKTARAFAEPPDSNDRANAWAHNDAR